MLDTDGFAELCARGHMWHRVWAPNEAELTAKVDSIIEHGLERVTTHYTDFWVSRPGHVYLGTLAMVTRLRPACRDQTVPSALLRIDVSQLQRARVNPDEDYWMTHNFISHKDARAGERACRHWHLPWPPSNWVWEWGRYLRMPLPSLGEWAEQVDLGSDPMQARYSLRKGSIAYNGIVPPAAITVVRQSPMTGSL